MTRRSESLTNYLILAVFAAFALYPILGVLGAAVESPSGKGTSVLFGGGLHLGNFGTAWSEGHFASYLRSSLLVSVTVVVVTTFLSILSGYAFGTMSFRGRTTLFYVFLLGIMVPSEALVVPLYFDLRSLGLTDTYWALVLPQAAQSVAFGTFWMRAYFLTSSRALVEAARLDGATSWVTLWRVLVPVGRPAIITLTVLVFMWTWNEFLLPLVMVTKESLRTAPLGLAFFQGQYTSGYTLLAAGAVIVAFPVVVLYLFLQRHFIRGMLEGAVKE